MSGHRAVAIGLWLIASVPVLYLVGLLSADTPLLAADVSIRLAPVPFVAGVWFWGHAPARATLSWALPLSALAVIAGLLSYPLRLIVDVAVAVFALLFLFSPKFSESWLQAVRAIPRR